MPYNLQCLHYVVVVRSHPGRLNARGDIFPELTRMTLGRIW